MQVTRGYFKSFLRKIIQPKKMRAAARRRFGNKIAISSIPVYPVPVPTSVEVNIFALLTNCKTSYETVVGSANINAICVMLPTMSKRKLIAKYITIASPAFFIETMKKVRSALMNKYTTNSSAIDAIKYPKSLAVNSVAWYSKKISETASVKIACAKINANM